MSNSNKQNASTEEHIKQVAKQTFVEKGYAGTTTRDIAEAADVNLALINYYFRSKENLFCKVFKETIREFFASMLEILNTEIALQQKIELMIERDFEFLIQNPDVTMFILNEMRTNEHNMVEEIVAHNKFWDTYFFKQVQAAIDKGEMNPINPVELIILILGNVQFIFLAKPMLKVLSNLDEIGYNELIINHKMRIKEMLISFLFVNHPPSSR
jgi:TetR/AcrR family transcriptional regulator